jgi:hypothetical protein
VDLGGVRGQEALFGPVASDSTAFGVIDRVAADPTLLDALRAADARGRERFWELHGTPERLTIDVDATLVTAHSEKEQAAGNYKGGYGFHPLQAYADGDARGARRSVTTARRPRLLARGKPQSSHPSWPAVGQSSTPSASRRKRP